MSTPRRRPEPKQPHASRESKVRNSKVDQSGGTGHGIGEAPQSLRYKLGIGALVFFIVLFIVFDFVDRANANKKPARPTQTISAPPQNES